MARTKNAKVPEVGAEVPEFNLSSAQGGSLRLGMRTATGPVIVAFFRDASSEEDVEFFKKLAGKEDEINLALGDVVGIGVLESSAAREFVKATGMKSYILYDYAKVATPAWGLLERDRKNGDRARPATFLVDSENKVVASWLDERPNPDELLAKVSEITGLPKEPEEEEEKPKKGKAKDEAKDEAAKTDDSGEASEKPEKPSPEEREKRRVERKAARESGDKGESKSENERSGEAAGSAEGAKAGASAGEGGAKPESGGEKAEASSEDEGSGASSGGESAEASGGGEDEDSSGDPGEKKEGA